MIPIRDFINKHSLPIFFILVFIISWGAILILVGLDGIPVSPDKTEILGTAMLLGPTIAGLLMIGFTTGRIGIRDLWSRLLKWRVSARWYAFALLVAPLSTLVILLLLSLFSHEFIPALSSSEDKAALIIMGLISGVIVGLFEELGWTGFATPRMRRRWSIFVSGFIIGIIWGAWHFILFWESDTFSGALPFFLLLARLFSWLPAYRIIMVWVYDHTESLMVVILMHASLVATLAIFDPPLSGEGLLTLILARAAVLWIIVAVIVLADPRPSGKLQS